jgi:predicted nucleic acid-binding protein
VESCYSKGLEMLSQRNQQVLATLRASRADYLITGDKDLLALAGKYPIVTPAAFWERHG